VKILTLLLAGITGALSAGQPFAWPGGARCAVSLTYDDALASHLAVAAPALDKAGLKGTFFLSGIKLKGPGALDPWAKLQKGGHEIASHSLLHACPDKTIPGQGANALEKYDLARMQAELKESRALLAQTGRQSRGMSYAYPCGQTWVGANHDSFIGLVKGLFIAGRGVNDQVADPWTVDLNNTPGINGARSADGLRYFAEQAEENGGWAIFMFHGVGGDYLATKAEAHEALLDYLKSAEGLVWVAPFGEVAAWITQHRK
jgi:peptidoglycan/xylan/chitin deacetylase (PgdA/CDA1 family)